MFILTKPHILLISKYTKNNREQTAKILNSYMFSEMDF